MNNLPQGFLLIAIFVCVAIFGGDAFAEPLGGWDTFPGPVAEPTKGD